MFARLRELAGRNEWTCDVAEGASVGDVWRALAAAHPDVESLGSTISAAVNEDFASMRTVLHEGDEVAFLPPVSGGQDARTPA